MTEDGLSIKCILPNKLSNENISEIASFDAELKDLSNFSIQNGVLLEAMASCHSISCIGGKLAGDPLDINMFEFTDWNLIEPIAEQTRLFQMFVTTIVHPKSKSLNVSSCAFEKNI